MHRLPISTRIFFGIFAMLAAAVNSAELELDPDLMLAIEDVNKSMSSNIALKSSKAATADAKELTAMFATVKTYFVQKGGADNAVELTQKSHDLTLEIVQFIADNNFDAASNSATKLARTCKTCHTFYKKE